MHMADALLSPGTGGAMWLASGVALAVAARRLRERADEALVPLMGILGAFVFAAQMINFTIPATGSSGHLGGGLLLAILLGPDAALLVIASVLTVQALCFADGGLLALGANLFNLGVLPCCIAYPLLYRPLARAGCSDRRAAFAALVAAVAGLQLGALGVVLQTALSGISSLPVGTFLLLMLPIHLAIGVAEGLASAALVLYLRRTRPELLARPAPTPPAGRPSRGSPVAAWALAALFTGAVLSWFVSTQPDGLEWAVARVSGSSTLPAPQRGVHAVLARWQERLAWLPGYDLPAAPDRIAAAVSSAPAAWPAVKPATSLAGVFGGGATLALVMAIGVALRRKRGAVAAASRHPQAPPQTAP